MKRILKTFSRRLYQRKWVSRVVKINGQMLNVAGMTIEEYLKSTKYEIKHIAVERNEEIVPKHLYEETILEEGDELEVVSFVGGG